MINKINQLIQHMYCTAYCQYAIQYSTCCEQLFIKCSLSSCSCNTPIYMYTCNGYSKLLTCAFNFPDTGTSFKTARSNPPVTSSVSMFLHLCAESIGLTIDWVRCYLAVVLMTNDIFNASWQQLHNENTQ